MSNFIEIIGVVGIAVSLIPTAIGFLFILLAVLTRPNHSGVEHNLFHILAFIIKNPEEIAYGSKIFLRWGFLLILSVILVQNF